MKAAGALVLLAMVSMLPVICLAPVPGTGGQTLMALDVCGQHSLAGVETSPAVVEPVFMVVSFSETAYFPEHLAHLRIPIFLSIIDKPPVV
jgi:hypothetical protein